jgi:hypothetical protein
MKRGPKPGNGKYLRVSATIEKTLKAEIDSRTENLSGYLNQAGWDKVRKDAKGAKHSDYPCTCGLEKILVDINKGNS